MIRCVVYLLRIFKMFHGLTNNPVYIYIYNSGLKEDIALGEHKQYLCIAKRVLYRYKTLPHKKKALISGGYALQQQNNLINQER